ncbi:MAG TPA: hypothetical protein PL143_12405 [Rhodocyclaceae bacterium]|nr:hypothetical protein [Rhodocyclaceae bacterium]
MDYRNPADCLDALRRLHPLDIDGTHRTLAQILEDQLDAQPAPNQHLEVVEALRAPLALVQQQLAHRYAAHPMPPASAENRSLERVIGLWRLMARSYTDILHRDASEGTLDDQRALLAHRRVFYTAQPMIEHFRAHRSLPPGLWAQLHESYAMAEALGVVDIRVTDALNEVWQAQSAAQAYIAALLIDIANPFGRGEREFEWVCRWAQRFAPNCSLAAPDGTDEAPKPTSYGIDLASDHGLRPIGMLAGGATLRRFDGSQLAGQIQAIMAEFRLGVQPAALGLGADCAVDAAARLLVSLYRPWGLASIGRRFKRRRASGQVELTGDWLAIGFHVQGKLFEQPKYPTMMRSLRSDIELLTFGERVASVEPTDPEQRRRRDAEKLGFVCERWDMLDESVGGFRLRQTPTAERLEHLQLVALRPPDGEHFLLGQISWLVFQADGHMEVGVNLLNGLPKVIAVRQTGLTRGQPGGYQQAFSLPETPAMKKPPSLVLPAGWFQPHAVIEIHDGDKRHLRLVQLLARGPNFDQVSYEAVNGTA